jgi:hypothetical protein
MCLPGVETGPALETRKKLSRIAVSHPRLRHVASRADETDYWDKVCRRLHHVLEPRPTNNLEDEDDDHDGDDLHAPRVLLAPSS